MRIVPVAYDHPDAQRLVEQLQHEHVVRYGVPDTTAVQISEFEPPQGLFLVGYLGEQAVVSGGWRGAVGDPVFREGDAELKRMYVAPRARGRGFARRMLRELERTACEAGYERLLLVTGTEQPEAIALYSSSGYEPTATFGPYRDEDDCRCFAKRC